VFAYRGFPFTTPLSPQGPTVGLCLKLYGGHGRPQYFRPEWCACWGGGICFFGGGARRSIETSMKTNFTSRGCYPVLSTNDVILYRATSPIRKRPPP